MADAGDSNNLLAHVAQALGTAIGLVVLHVRQRKSEKARPDGGKLAERVGGLEARLGVQEATMLEARGEARAIEARADAALKAHDDLDTSRFNELRGELAEVRKTTSSTDRKTSEILGFLQGQGRRRPRHELPADDDTPEEGSSVR